MCEILAAGEARVKVKLLGGVGRGEAREAEVKVKPLGRNLLLWAA